MSTYNRIVTPPNYPQLVSSLWAHADEWPFADFTGRKQDLLGRCGQCWTQIIWDLEQPVNVPKSLNTPLLIKLHTRSAHHEVGLRLDTHIQQLFSFPSPLPLPARLLNQILCPSPPHSSIAKAPFLLTPFRTIGLKANWE